MKINRVLDVDKLDHHIRNGYITARRHPHLPLTIYNYTPKTQYENLWDDITMHCRGLIVDWQGDVVGNCLAKFFNHNDPHAADAISDGPVQVTDKLDGSYLAVCKYEDQLVTATRGSFESRQAHEAMEIINARSDYKRALNMLCEDSTAIFEVIYPGNRIVLNYGAKRDIVLIGTIANFQLSCGTQLWTPGKDINWPGEAVQHFALNSLEEALAMPPRENAEGIVVYFEKTGKRIKIKQDDYLALHRIMTNCTARRIWEYMAVDACKNLIEKPQHWGTYVGISPDTAKEILAAGANWKEKFLTNVPDEFYSWVDAKINFIQQEHDRIEREATEAFEQFNEEACGDRGTFARLVRKHQHWDLIFELLDGNSIERAIWKRICPEHEKPFMDADEAE
jgi:RNA ligase